MGLKGGAGNWGLTRQSMVLPWPGWRYSFGSVARGDVLEAASAGAAGQETVTRTHCECEIGHGRI